MEISDSFTRVSSPVEAAQAQPITDSATDASQPRLMKAMKLQYQVDQQTKYLDLQAEMESLLQQLKDLKRQRETVDERVLVEASSR
ncbi:MAG: hypothetical protein IGS48_13995 [Oscillatoriales cyanobacterium C42_A2020_001]|nr:hypothetical protein [Leptolyngbyaceae cyanobacterium C42_A2020_001]